MFKNIVTLSTFPVALTVILAAIAVTEPNVTTASPANEIKVQAGCDIIKTDSSKI